MEVPIQKEQMSKLEIEEQNILIRLFTMVNKLIDYSLTKITEYMSEVLERELTKDEALQILEDNPQLLNPQYVDEAIARNAKAAFIISTSISAASSILRHDKQWYEELRRNGDKIILQIVITYRPDLYELLKDKPKLTQFLINYILTKLKVR